MHRRGACDFMEPRKIELTPAFWNKLRSRSYVYCHTRSQQARTVRTFAMQREGW